MSDANSSYMSGAALAPDLIRESLHCESSNRYSEHGIDLASHPRFLDVGNREIEADPTSFMQIEGHIAEILEQDALPLVLGGDHSITYPVMRAINRFYGPVNILHFDAHPDLYDDFEGNPYSHASPFARVMEEGLADRLVSVGIRTMNPHQQEQAERFGVEIIKAGTDWRETVTSLQSPLYLSLDLDILDPAFAPGISHHEPGGLSTREVLDIIHALPHPPIGADIVELNPDRDLNGVTAMVTAKFLKEILAGMLG